MRKLICFVWAIIFMGLINSCRNDYQTKLDPAIEKKIDKIIAQMTLQEKIGQMIQINGFSEGTPPEADSLIKAGLISSILNEVDVDEMNRLQRIAVEESRLGIPILFGRDVIHGFRTIFPIPLGQAATWNPELVKEGASVAAIESRSAGVRWTFAPVIDVTRDPRWGRVAESFGEDTYLTSIVGGAMVKGFQGSNLKGKNSLIACPKHFAGYGAVEGGRDYHTVSIPENELRDVYLPPFKMCINEGAMTIMTAFNELNGVPASGNRFLMQQVLRDEWGFTGFVVSDWSSVSQLVDHGFAENNREAACKAIKAGVDMEMASTTYRDHIENLLKAGELSIKDIDEAVRRILRVKFITGLFEQPYTDVTDYPEALNQTHKNIAREMARQSLVLLKNKNNILPIKDTASKVAVIGPLADAPHDQLGTWIFDGNKNDAITPLTAIKSFIGESQVFFARGMEISRTLDNSGFSDAVKAAGESDIILLFIGEESILSGESHCRADISLPGVQEELIQVLSKTGKPLVAIIMAGRPLTFEKVLPYLDAVIYAWHPGTMAGPAIMDIIYGRESPSGKLPITFPRVVGQIPVYYNQKNSGKPASDETWERMYDIPVEAPQLSVGNTNHYIDYGFEPMFPFGFGLSYSQFKYSDIQVSENKIKTGESVKISAVLSNTGNYKATEVVQLYIRDLVGSRTRPVKELKGFQRITLLPGEDQKVVFELNTNDLAFHNQEMEYVTEPGKFHVWIGGSSKAELKSEFSIIK